MTNTTEPRRLLDNLHWVHVGLATVLCGTVFSLVMWGKQDLGTISTFITAIAAVVGAYYMKGVRQDSQETKVLANGNLARKDLEIAVLQKQLFDAQRLHTQEIAQMAAAAPSSASLPSSLTTEEHAGGSEAFTGPTVQVPTLQRT